MISGGLVTHSATAVDGPRARARRRGPPSNRHGGCGSAAWWASGLLLRPPSRGRRPLWPGRGGSPSPFPAFSQLAIPAVGVLAISGLALARLHLTAWDELLRTPVRALAHGQAPRLRRDARPGRATTSSGSTGGCEPRSPAARADGATVARFRRSLRTEAGLGVVALLFAAVLAQHLAGAPRGGRREPGFSPRADGSTSAQVRLDVTPLAPGAQHDSADRDQCGRTPPGRRDRRRWCSSCPPRAASGR